MATEGEYTYKYCSWEPDDPEDAAAMVALNTNQSFRMDKLRNEMAPTAQQLHQRVLDHAEALRIGNELRDNGRKT